MQRAAFHSFLITCLIIDPRFFFQVLIHCQCTCIYINPCKSQDSWKTWLYPRTSKLEWSVPLYNFKAVTCLNHFILSSVFNKRLALLIRNSPVFIIVIKRYYFMGISLIFPVYCNFSSIYSNIFFFLIFA